MSTRITNGMRDEIADKLMAVKFKNEARRLLRDRANIADFIYHHIYTDKTLAKMEALPVGWLPTSNHISAIVNGAGRNFKFNGMSYYNNREEKIIPRLADFSKIPDDKFLVMQDRHISRNVEVFNGNDAVGILVFENDTGMKKLKDEYSALRAKTRAALHEFRTIERLIAEWPETKPYISADMRKARLLPVVNVADLNAAIGLPV